MLRGRRTSASTRALQIQSGTGRASVGHAAPRGDDSSSSLVTPTVAREQRYFRPPFLGIFWESNSSDSQDDRS